MATYREARRYSREKVSPRWQAAEGNKRPLLLFAAAESSAGMKGILKGFSVCTCLLSDGFWQDRTRHDVTWHGNRLHDPSFSCKENTLVSSKSLLVILNFYILIVCMFSPCPCRRSWKLGPAYPEFGVSSYICSVLNFCVLRAGCIHHRQE